MVIARGTAGAGAGPVRAGVGSTKAMFHSGQGRTIACGPRCGADGMVRTRITGASAEGTGAGPRTVMPGG